MRHAVMVANKLHADLPDRLIGSIIMRESDVTARMVGACHKHVPILNTAFPATGASSEGQIATNLQDCLLLGAATTLHTRQHVLQHHHLHEQVLVMTNRLTHLFLLCSEPLCKCKFDVYMIDADSHDDLWQTLHLAIWQWMAIEMTILAIRQSGNVSS